MQNRPIFTALLQPQMSTLKKVQTLQALGLFGCLDALLLLPPHKGELLLTGKLCLHCRRGCAAQRRCQFRDVLAQQEKSQKICQLDRFPDNVACL